MMIFNDDEFLSGPELRQRLKISRNVWEKYRPKIIEDLKLYCSLEVIGNGNRLTYHIIHQHNEYIKFKVGRNSKEQNNQIYTKEILKSTYHYPLATYASITRDIVNKKEIEELNHAFSTSYGYVRNCTKEAFGAAEGEEGLYGYRGPKEWARENQGRYIAIPEAHKETIKQLLSEGFGKKGEEIADIITDKENDIITPQEAKAKNNKLTESIYFNAIEQFMKLYGYRPTKVPRYMINALKVNIEEL